MIPPLKKATFQKGILQWDEKHNTRKHLWKSEKDPYKVWIREIILQQTRVEQAFDKYLQFINLFPDTRALAAAKEDAVYKAWEGLGYYSRCKNLIATAKEIHTLHKGVFPNTYDALLSLKGIGDYTASAILSFCFDKNYAVYDGNVERVLSRYIGFDKDVKKNAHKRYLRNTATSFLPPKRSAGYNQAIMDFGASVCKPRPLCEKCILQRKCAAFFGQKQNDIPYKRKRVRVKNIYWIFVRIRCREEIAIQKKEYNTLWKQLYLPPVIELESAEELQNDERILQAIEARFGGEATSNIDPAVYTQLLSHRKVFSRWARIKVNSKKKLSPLKNIEWKKKEELKDLYFPVIMRDKIQLD